MKTHHSGTRRGARPARRIVAHGPRSAWSPRRPSTVRSRPSIGGDKVSVTTLAKADRGPALRATPSRPTSSPLNRADVLIEGGADLEVGWLPPLLEGRATPSWRSGARATSGRARDPAPRRSHRARSLPGRHPRRREPALHDGPGERAASSPSTSPTRSARSTRRRAPITRRTSTASRRRSTPRSTEWTAALGSVQGDADRHLPPDVALLRAALRPRVGPVPRAQARDPAVAAASRRGHAEDDRAQDPRSSSSSRSSRGRRPRRWRREPRRPSWTSASSPAGSRERRTTTSRCSTRTSRRSSPRSTRRSRRRRWRSSRSGSGRSWR